MQVYGDGKSGNCLKVKWLLDRLGLQYDWREVDVASGFTRSPEFLALNPAGQVPLVVLDEGRTLAQSNAILLHFGEGSSFVPLDAYARARMHEWMFWEQYSHEPYVAVARFRMLYLGEPRDQLDPELLQRGAAALARLDAALADSPFLVGEAPTLADLALVAYTRVAPEGGFNLNSYSNLPPWIARVEQAFAIA